MALPTQKTPKIRSLSGLKIFLYGNYKIGKSTYCSKFPDTLFLDTERGLAHLESYQIQVNSWEVFKQTVAELSLRKHPFKTIVVDTIDNLYDFCRKYSLDKENKVHESDLAYGKGWKLVRAEFREGILKLLNLNYTTIFTSHSKTKEVDSRTGKYNKTIPTLDEYASDLLLGVCDLILFAESELQADKTYQRILRTKPTQFVIAGDRMPEECKLPAKIPLDYDKFVQIFNECMAKESK